MNSRWIDAGGVVCARERVAHSELHLGWLGLPSGVAAGGEWCEPPIRLVLFEAGAADVDWRRGIIAGIHHRRVSMLRRRSFFPQEAENFSEQQRRWRRGAHQSNASRLIPTSIAHNFFGFFFRSTPKRQLCRSIIAADAFSSDAASQHCVFVWT